MNPLRLKHFNASFHIQGKKYSFNKIPFTHKEYKVDGFVLRLLDNDALEFKLQSISGKEFYLEHVEYEFELPLRNFGKVIIPDSGRFYMTKFFPRQVWNHRFKSTHRALANPYFCLLNMHEEVDFSFGLLGKIYESEFYFYSPGANKKNSLTVYGGVANAKLKWKVSFPILGMPIGNVKEFHDGIFQSSGEKSWFHNLRKYGSLYQKIHHLTYNVQANGFRPAICTWRIINSDNMTHDWIIETAKRAKNLGMKALIFDDGWYGVGLDGRSLKSDMGDWPITIPGKFKDIRKTIEEVKKIGIAPVLWFCPIGVGPAAKIKKKVEHLLSRVHGEIYTCPAKFHTMCVRSPEAREVMVNNLLKLIDYGAEGIKSDLFDYMPDDKCDAQTHSHDCETTSEGIRKTFRLLYDTIMKVKPDLIYSEKNNYGTVELAPDGSHVRGGDSPFDENINTLRSIYPAAYMPVVHNDYLAFSNFEVLDKLAVMLMKQITTGVPNFSINLDKLSKRHAAVLKAWLQFYNQHIDLYKTGIFEPQNSVMTVFERKNSEKVFISILAGAREIEWVNRNQIYILNTTPFDKIYISNPMEIFYSVEYYDYKLKLKKTDRVKIDNPVVQVAATGLTIFRETS